MKRQTLPTLVLAALLALALAYVSIRHRSGLYIVTDLEGRETAAGYACDINPAGQVAGYTEASPGKRGQGFLYGIGVRKALSAPAVRSEAHGLNAYGMVVGWFYDNYNQAHACRCWNNRVLGLGTLGGGCSQAYAVNTAGQIVGGAMTARTERHAFLWTDARMQDLGTLGGGFSEAHGINDTGEIIGSAQTAEATSHAFLWADGHMQDLGTLGGDHSFAWAINEVGQAAGYADTTNGATHAFLYSDGTMRDLGTLPEGTGSFAYGLNAEGEVVGSADTNDGETHAFVYKDGRMKDLNRLIPAHSGWVLAEARAINDKGQIVGSGLFNGKTRAFLLTPQ